MADKEYTKCNKIENNNIRKQVIEMDERFEPLSFYQMKLTEDENDDDDVDHLRCLQTKPKVEAEKFHDHLGELEIWSKEELEEKNQEELDRDSIHNPLDGSETGLEIKKKTIRLEFWIRNEL